MITHDQSITVNVDPNFLCTLTNLIIAINDPNEVLLRILITSSGIVLLGTSIYYSISRSVQGLIL